MIKAGDVGMNKTALKTFATSARKELLKKVEAKAMKIGVTEDNIKKADIESSDAIFIDGRQLSKEEKGQRDKLIDRINQIGLKQVLEEVSYTWFNRFTALRYMEVNDYLPSGVRVLSSSNPNSADPDLLNEALELDFEIEMDKEYIYELKLNNKTEELFKYLIIKHCNDLNRFLPFMFETIDDYTEILFPEGLLAKDSFIRQMTDPSFIPEEDWTKVEIIGWLYQYYIAEEKDRVIKAKKKYKTEEIPFATQLFTPDWIVRYMVQNSLGRYWVESHSEHQDLLENWEFYLENPNPEKDFEEKLAPYINKELKVEEIKCFDPAMGSGHILVYMFDVLYEIYSKCGYMEREIPRLIIENNLYGLDIDDRAYQLACFSVVMKALGYNSRFFRSIEREGLTLNLASIQETSFWGEAEIIYISGESEGTHYKGVKQFVENFKNAKTLGSLIKVMDYDKKFLEQRFLSIQNNPAKDLFNEEVRSRVVALLSDLLKQAEIMHRQYDILVTNPPYMSSATMSTVLYDFLKKNYPDSKQDLFACFMEISHYQKDNGYFACLNQHSWMFLSSFEDLREKIIDHKTICTMLHLGPHAFEEFGGEVVQTTAFVLRNKKMAGSSGLYLRLVDEKNSNDKKQLTLDLLLDIDPNKPFFYSFRQEFFKEIPGHPIAYWVSNKEIELFKNEAKIGDYYDAKGGMTSGNNNLFLRYWYEVDYRKIGRNLSKQEAFESDFVWFPYNKGGIFRKWYGNMEYVINWYKDGKYIKEYKLKQREKDPNYNIAIAALPSMFKPQVSWSRTASTLSIRYYPKGFLFDVAGSSIILENNESEHYLLGLLNTVITKRHLEILNPTINRQPGNIKDLIFIKKENERIDQIVEKNVTISRTDWDSFETSWDFKVHPLLKYESVAKTGKIEKAFAERVLFTKEQFRTIKRNEEELNQIFLEIYGLQEEMSPELSDEEISIYIADQTTEMKSFISYAIGCIFGRYSLEKEGIVYAGGNFDPDTHLSLKVDEDNILPILSGSYIENDIVSRFIEFVQIVFGKETLSENLEFLAISLGKKKNETAKETIRRYFLNDFFKDHLQTYKKRPIYWLFTSGKQKAFNCLIYIHRYDRTTLSRIRTDYLHEYQIRLDAEKKDLLSIIEGNYTTKEISNAKKELKILDKKIEELKEYDELLHHMADMQIEIDLDDGVAVNYEKFKGLLANI